MTPTLHFIYAVPYRPTRLQRSRHYAHILLTALLTGRVRMPWRDGHTLPGRRVVHAPDSIVVHLVEHFKKSYRVHLYDWTERYANVECGPDDIVIGHVTPSGSGPMNRFLRSGRPARAKIMLQPFSHRLVEEHHFTLPYIGMCDAYAAICGPYWFDTIEESPFSCYRDKMHRVDMAIDVSSYPRLKTRFRDKGQRRFLYIGHNRRLYKGCAHLAALAQGMPSTHFGWIGDGAPIAGVHHIAGNRELTPEFMRWVCEEYDCFITMGVSDPNPTTILEAMAWGLPVVCTPQSGYHNIASIMNVSLEDQCHNRCVVHRLQMMDDTELLQISETNRNLVEQYYTWNRFVERVDEIIRTVID